MTAIPIPELAQRVMDDYNAAMTLKDYQMSRDKEYADYCIRAGIENRNSTSPYQNVYPQPEVKETAPVVEAVAHLENQLAELQDRIRLLEMQLSPVCGPLEAHEDRLGLSSTGNSPIAIKINHQTGVAKLMTQRITLLTAALEV